MSARPYRTGRAGSGPAGPAGTVPYRFTDEPGPCQCGTCSGECPCLAMHVSGLCACCRVGAHSGDCPDPPSYNRQAQPADKPDD